MRDSIVRWAGLIGASVAFSWAVKLAVQMSTVGLSLTFLAVTATVLILRSIFLTVVALIGGIAILVAGLRLTEIVLNRSAAPLSGSLVLALYLVACLAMVAICWKSAPKVPSVSEWMTTGIVLTSTFWFSKGIPRTAAGALQLLASSGEDSAAWIEALGKSTTATGTMLTNQSSYGGGFGSGVGLVLFRQLHLSTSNNYANGISSNGVLLVRILFLIAVLSAILAATGVAWLLKDSSMAGRISASTAAGLLAYSMSIGMSAFGHFSSAFAGLLVLCGVLLATTAGFGTGLWGYIAATVVVLTVIVSGLSWYPLLLAAFVLTLAFSLFCLVRFLQWARSKKIYRMGIFGLLVVAPISYVGLRRAFSSVISNLNWEYYSFNTSLVGGVQQISGIVALAGLISLVALASAAWKGVKALDVSRFAAILTPLIIAGYVGGIYVLSFVADPYSPRYGAQKLLYVGALVSVPLVPALVGRAGHKRGFNLLGQLSIGPLLLLGLALVDPSRMFFNWPKAVKLVAPWSSAVVQELEREPNRKLVCLNTTTDPTLNYSGYLCTRMANGLQAKSNYAYNTWTAANIGQIPAEQAASAWDLSFYRGLTILLFDPTRLNSGEQQQIEWLSSVRWKAVKLIGPEGEIIKAPGVGLGDIAPPLAR
jgi:hypothetical protein